MKVRTGYDFDTYRQKVESGEWQLHTFPLGFVVTEIKQFKEERVCIVHLLGGERFAEWREVVTEHLKQFGREQGCKALEAVCRLGLEKFLKPIGWRRHRVLLRMDLHE